jgi:hypothetical protein
MIIVVPKCIDFVVEVLHEYYFTEVDEIELTTILRIFENFTTTKFPILATL